MLNSQKPKNHAVLTVREDFILNNDDFLYFKKQTHNIFLFKFIFLYLTSFISDNWDDGIDHIIRFS